MLQKILFSLLITSFVHATGPGTSGGGHGARADFYFFAGMLFDELAKLSGSTKEIELARRAFNEIDRHKYPEFSNIPLNLSGKTVNAINDYIPFSIVIDEVWWNRASISQKRIIIFHEFLGLARKYDSTIDDSDYKLSSRLLAQLEESYKNRRTPENKIALNFMFNPAQLRELNLASASDLEITRAKNKESLAQAPVQKCSSTPQGPGAHLSFRRESGINESSYTFTLYILCEETNGKWYAHTQGGNEIGVLKLNPYNLFEIQSPLGIAVVGAMSGKNLQFRTPMISIDLTENKNGTYKFIFEFHPVNGPAERITGTLEKN